MASIIELITVTFKPDLQPSPGHPPSSFVSSVCDQIGRVPGVVALHHGGVQERPSDWMLAVRWRSPAHLDGFLASAERTAWLARLHAVSKRDVIRRLSLAGRPVDALSAPCTEVFFALGTDGDFVHGRLKPFVEALEAEAMHGFHASAWGPLELVACHGDEQQPPSSDASAAAAMLIGWDSKEAHLAHRGDGKAIDRHIQIVRDGRKAVEVCHVKMTVSMAPNQL
ncbi:hypothetical protein L249_3432 [Ophiocordyceps polyrhachis-furcata BCC 54312]|uniref:ABM domain-containing protein n=1 Tax=Ophiocordyceps polyrhachis-furcata BCC 54312 TaxID=1330021 RepID=A0A367LMJ0_9HYPO|nr:hypothetical protein L249_3432 [Ophiocordyceps polyrhachis-furcata BCC 54312]